MPTEEYVAPPREEQRRREDQELAAAERRLRGPSTRRRAQNHTGSTPIGIARLYYQNAERQASAVRKHREWGVRRFGENARRSLSVENTARILQYESTSEMADPANEHQLPGQATGAEQDIPVIHTASQVHPPVGGAAGQSSHVQPSLSIKRSLRKSLATRALP